MSQAHQNFRSRVRSAITAALKLSVAVGLSTAIAGAQSQPSSNLSAGAPSPDPRIGLKPGVYDAGQAAWNMTLMSATPPSTRFVGSTNSDLAFIGHYAIQGSYDGYQIWDLTNPSRITLKDAYFCPASQSDVSVYKNLVFVSGEGLSGRLDCGAEGVKDTVSKERLRGIRIFDISDMSNPKYVANVQTCRGSHTHTLLVDPKDKANVYVYVSGSASVRSPSELPGCVKESPSENPNSALFRIEVIKVPLANPEKAAIVSSPRIFNDLVAPPTHGQSPADKEELDAARAKGAFIVNVLGNDMVLPDRMAKPMLDSLVKVRNGTGEPTGADSAALREALPGIIAKMIGARPTTDKNAPRPGPTQCHDITVYPAIGYAGGACEGYGLLLDIHDPAHPVRIDAVADSNFSYWHSATFNNDGTKVLFSDEWGGGGQPKCRASDPRDWGADAIFTLANGKLDFQSYYKLPVAQTSLENCVAHNGSLIPIPGRDVMVQSWYQGGVSVFDWTDPTNAHEIAFFDRGPMDSTRMVTGGTWSAYWYNGLIVSSEIGRGLDVFELKPSDYLTQNEIDAAKTVKLDYLNVQGQPHFVWPASFSLARAYVDQLARSNGLSADQISSVRADLASAESASGAQRRATLAKLASKLNGDENGSSDASKVKMLASAVTQLAAAR